MRINLASKDFSHLIDYPDCCKINWIENSCNNRGNRFDGKLVLRIALTSGRMTT